MTRLGAFSCALLVACGGSSVSHDASGDAGPVVDAAARVDAESQFDASAPEAGDGGAFGAPCSADAQCASGVCLTVGRCSKPCDGRSDCPPAPEWQCAPTAGGGGRTYCACTPSGPEVCDGRDNDCDTIVDGPNATCPSVGNTCQNSQCVCPPVNQCGGGCVDTTTDRRNCGACGNACPVLCAGSTCRTVLGLCATEYITCVRTSDLAVRCVGDNVHAEIGDGTTDFRPAFTVNRAGPAALLACGGEIGCVGRTDGTVHCWGWPMVGNGLVGTVAIPTEIPSLAGARALAVAAYHACAVRADGSVACWGANDKLQLGTATHDQCQTGTWSVPACSKVPITVPGMANVADVAVGDKHSCALHTNGDVECWGSNELGALGDGSTAPRGPTGVRVVRSAIQIAAGGATTCALLSGGIVACWGDGSSGQLVASAPGGACGTSCSDGPLVIPGLAGVVGIAMGYGHVCARLSDATVSCWGDDRAGEVGSAPTATCPSGACVTTPTRVPGVSGVTAIVLGDSDSFAILAEGTLVGWGSDIFGTLGDGRTANTRTTPAPPLW